MKRPITCKQSFFCIIMLLFVGSTQWHHDEIMHQLDWWAFVMSLQWTHQARIPPAEGAWMWGQCVGRGGAADQRGRCAYSGFRLQAVGSRTRARGGRGRGLPGLMLHRPSPHSGVSGAQRTLWDLAASPITHLLPQQAERRNERQATGVSCAALEGAYRWS